MTHERIAEIIQSGEVWHDKSPVDELDQHEIDVEPLTWGEVREILDRMTRAESALMGVEGALGAKVDIEETNTERIHSLRLRTESSEARVKELEAALEGVNGEIAQLVEANIELQDEVKAAEAALAQDKATRIDKDGICPVCLTHFGYEDANVSHEQLRHARGDLRIVELEAALKAEQEAHAEKTAAWHACSDIAKKAVQDMGAERVKRKAAEAELAAFQASVLEKLEAAWTAGWNDAINSPPMIESMEAAETLRQACIDRLLADPGEKESTEG
jgi:DNA repair exonuclease SbcCD ATPase subunit